MTVQTISVTRALVELKRLDERIQKAISGGVFVARTVGTDTKKKVVGTNDSIADVSAKILGSFDKVQSLIANRAAIKSAIVMSNAATKVSILGKEVSVAEAIELKSTVQFRTQYVNTLRHQLTNERNLVDRANIALETEIEAAVTTLLGADKRSDEANVKSITDVKKSQKEQALLDAGKIEDKIAAVETDILNLTSELDFVLSESNAKTVISVDL